KSTPSRSARARKAPNLTCSLQRTHGFGVRPARCSSKKSESTVSSKISLMSTTSKGKPAMRATVLASSRARGPQHPWSTPPPGRWSSRRCDPITSYPCSSNRHADTDESTPPDIATRTEPFEAMARCYDAVRAAEGILPVAFDPRSEMNVVVLVKYVPDPQGTPELDDAFLVVREGTEGALDPGDEYAVEAGLRLVETHGGEVTLLTMGPETASAALRKGLSMGAHAGVHGVDPALRGSDALATARVLAAAVRRRPFDLVLAGVESTDGSTGTVPMTVAQLLELPSATFARALSVEDGVLRIERPTDLGFDVVEAPLPALATVTGSAPEPRYPTLKGIMQAKQKPVERLALTDLGLSAEALAPTQRVVGLTRAQERAAGEVIQAGEDTAKRIVDLLAEAKVL